MNPSAQTITWPTLPFTHAYTNPGTYTVTCTAYTVVQAPANPSFPNGFPTTNAVGTASITLIIQPAPPVITTQPASTGVTMGGKATFSVVAIGSGSLTYQWKKNGTAISGATAASYTTPAVAMIDDQGKYSVVVSNAQGGTTSAVATLTILLPPTITTQPANTNVLLWQPGTLSVKASGTSPFTYQWKRNGTNINGATGPSHTLLTPETADNGSVYSVVVKNAYGSATSANATLTVTTPTQSTLVDFNTMMYNQTGLIHHTITATLNIYVLIPRNPPYDMELVPQWKYSTQTLFAEEFHWSAPMGLFPARTITAQQAMAAGVSQQQITTLGTPDPSSTYGLRSITFTEECAAAWDPVDAGTNDTKGMYANWVDAVDRRQGTLKLAVDIPATPTNYWRMGVISALGEECYTKRTLSPGPQIFEIRNVEAGNCLVSLAAIDGNSTLDNPLAIYHREVPVIVRKDTPGVAAMKFVTDRMDPKRFRLHALTLGQNSQNEKGEVFLTQGRDAMVRVMAVDTKGEGAPTVVKVDTPPTSTSFNTLLEAFNASGTRVWTTTFQNPVNSFSVKSGRVSGSTCGPILPGQFIQSGFRLQASLLGSSNQVLDTLSITPNVTRPRTIIIHGYDVRPYPGASGCPGARNPTEMYASVLPYTQEVFPNSNIQYVYEGKIWIADPAPPWPFNGGSLVGQARLGVTMLTMNQRQGWHKTDPNAEVEHLFLGMMNDTYIDGNTKGIALYGFRGLAAARVQDATELGYNIAHEMGHNFGLYHPPSRGAGSNILNLSVFANRVDGSYPYGGGGLAGGWGYSAKATSFLSEDAQTFVNRNPHWDTMSYTQYYIPSNTRFSDAYALGLRPQFSGAAVGSSLPAVTLSKLPSGILVFDDTSASQTQSLASALEAQASGASAMVVSTSTDAEPRAYVAPAVDPLKGLDPSKGDPDDPTPPILIITKIPAISGVTVFP